MSESDRRGAAALVLAIVGLVVFFMGFWSGRHDRGYSEQATQYASSPRSYSSEEIAAACGIATGLDLIECTRRQVEAEREAKHEEDDLAAQNKMADWAFLMMLVSGVGTGATAFGIWLVYLNLREARRVTRQAIRANQYGAKAAAAAVAANATARQIGEAQARAYVGVDKVRLRQVATKYSPVVEITYKNTGQSPARRVRHRAATQFFVGTGQSRLPSRYRPKLDRDGVNLGAGDGFAASVVLNRGFWEHYLPALLGRGARLYVYGEIAYFDVFSVEHHTTYCFYLYVGEGATKIKDTDLFILADRGNKAD